MRAVSWCLQSSYIVHATVSVAERGVEAYHVTKGQSNDSVHCIHPADDDGALWDVTDDGESRNTVKQRVGKRMNVKSRLGKRTRKNGT